MKEERTEKYWAVCKIILLFLLNLLPLIMWKWIIFVPQFDWAKGPLSFEKPGYPPLGSEGVFFTATVIMIDLYLLITFFLRKKLADHSLYKFITKYKMVFQILFFIVSLIVVESSLRSYVNSNVLTPFRPHPTLFWQNYPNLKNFYNPVKSYYITTNSIGMRGEEIPFKKPADTIRIIGLGDSSFFGHGVDFQSTWTMELQRQLSHRVDRKRVEVLNGAVPGWTTYQGLYFLKNTGLKFKPDFVIVAFNNDPGLDITEEKYRNTNPHIIKKIQEAAYQSEIYMFILKMVKSNIKLTNDKDNYFAKQIQQPNKKKKESELSDEDLVPRISYEDYKNNILEFYKLSQEHGFILILVNMPVNLPFYDNIPDHIVQERLLRTSVRWEYRDAMKQIAKENNISLLDVHSQWSSEDKYHLIFYQHVFHPTAEGHIEIGGMLADLIEEQLKKSNSNQQ